MSYKQRVGGSNPSTPTKSLTEMWGFFLIHMSRNQVLDTLIFSTLIALVSHFIIFDSCQTRRLAYHSLQRFLAISFKYSNLHKVFAQITS